MKQPAKRSGRGIAISAGLILSAVGVLVTRDLMSPAAERMLPLGLQSLIFMGPVLLAVGFVTLLRGFAWGATSVGRWGVLVAGLLMLVIGGCPWLYTSYLTGGRPGNEGVGMLGTLVFIFVGLPGLALTLAGLLGLLFKPRNSKKGGSDG